MHTFNPRLDILPAPQRRLWTELHEVPRNFVLYGGTAIALRLGHRQSIDFDFFSFGELDSLALLDLAGTKAAVVQVRAEAKDYLDLDAILTSGIDLPHALGAASAIYGASFNPQITLKALSYFEDGDLAQLPDEFKERMAMAARTVDLDRLPALAADRPT